MTIPGLAVYVSETTVPCYCVLQSVGSYVREQGDQCAIGVVEFGIENTVYNAFHIGVDQLYARILHIPRGLHDCGLHKMLQGHSVLNVMPKRNKTLRMPCIDVHSHTRNHTSLRAARTALTTAAGITANTRIIVVFARKQP